MFGNSDSPAIVESICDGSIRLQQSAIEHENIVEETPLVIACKNGNLKQVRHLVEEAQVNVDQRSTIWRGNNRCFPTNGSALHASVIAGRTQIVKYLVDCCKIDINAKTQSPHEPSTDCNLTALHLAVSYLSGDVQKEIVTCLLAHGADWTIVDVNGKQCWELTDDVEITKVLINFGVGLKSSRNSKSMNIAHKWAKSFEKRSVEVIALAIDKGINIFEPDGEGSTPLILAAIGVDGQPNGRVANVMFKKIYIPIDQRMIAYGLTGASYIFKGNFYGLELMKRAMKLSLRIYGPYPNHMLSDDIKTALNVTSEVNNMAELESIGHDLDLLQVQAHLIRLRILGLEHSETMYCLASDALRIRLNKEPQTFFNYLHLILKGNWSTEHSGERYVLIEFYYQKLIELSLLALTQTNDNMSPAKMSTFYNAMPILCKLVSLLNDSGSVPFTIDYILDNIVNLTHIILHSKPLTSQESNNLKCCLNEAIRLRKRNTDGLDLFLLACSKTEVSDEEEEYPKEYDEKFDEEYDEEGIDYMEEETEDKPFKRCASAKTISIFIEVGCDVNSVTNEGDTAFHVLAKKTTSFESMFTFELLHHAGVHLDQTNLQGKTMIDILRDRGIDLDASIIPSCLLQLPSLKCLCARLVPKHKIPLLEHIPGLPEFVMGHSSHQMHK